MRSFVFPGLEQTLLAPPAVQVMVHIGVIAVLVALMEVPQRRFPVTLKKPSKPKLGLKLSGPSLTPQRVASRNSPHLSLKHTDSLSKLHSPYVPNPDRSFCCLGLIGLVFQGLRV